jgi:hypothetical protein
MVVRIVIDYSAAAWSAGAAAHAGVLRHHWRRGRFPLWVCLWPVTLAAAVAHRVSRGTWPLSANPSSRAKRCRPRR